MTELALRASAPLSLDERMRLAEALAQASLLPSDYAKNPANVLLAIDYAQGLGLDPGLAVHVMDVIEGTPDLKASTLAGMVRRAGHRLRVFGDAKSATCQIIRADDPEFVYESVWTIEMAEAAGLTKKKNWVAYPADMLRNRAMKQCARMACSELFLGPIAAVDIPDGAPWPNTSTPAQQTAQAPPVTTVTVDTTTGEVLMSNKAQWQQIANLANGAQLGNDELRAEIKSIIGHPIASASDLTHEEAIDVIQALSAFLAAKAAALSVEHTTEEEETHQ